MRAIIPPPLADNFEILSTVREGKAVSSYIVYDKACGRKVLLKKGDAELIENEGRLMSAAQCDGVPAVFLCIEYEGESCLLREYVRGQTLREIIEAGGCETEREAAEILIKLLNVLSVLHSLDPPIVHRDIKAENIILTPEGKLYLIDFGIAREHSGTAPHDTVIMGTPASAPPEQFGFSETDPRSDIYSAGVLLKELCPKSAVNSSHAAKLAAIAEKSTAFSPDMRYDSAGAMSEELSRIFKKPPNVSKAIAAAAVALIIAAAGFFAGQCSNKVPTADPQGLAETESTAAVTTSAGETSAAISEKIAAEPPEEISPDSIYVFRDSGIENEVLRQTGKQKGTVTYADLERISTISLVGELPVDLFDISVNSDGITLDGVILWQKGSIERLDDLADMKNLRFLMLANQNITNISPLENLSLQQLCLHGNNIIDLSPLSGQTELERLYISENPVMDISPLAGLQSLEFINVGGTNIDTLFPLDQLPRLHGLELYSAPRLMNMHALDSMHLDYINMNPCTKEAFLSISQMESLQHVYIFSPRGYDRISQLSQLSGLETLWIDHAGFHSLDGVEELQQLRSLSLFWSDVDDISALRGNETIEEMWFFMTNIEDFSPLQEMKGLKKVYCDSYCYETVAATLKDSIIMVYKV